MRYKLHFSKNEDLKSQPVLLRKLGPSPQAAGQPLSPLGSKVQGSRTSSRNGTSSGPAEFLDGFNK